MARVANKMLPYGEIDGPPFVVEIVGPAAAGKSSLLRALIQSNEKSLILTGPERRRIRNIPFFASNALLSLPILIRQCRSGRGFTWKEIKTIVYLKGWHHALRRPAANGKITVLENGPVLRLAKLRAFGPGNLRSRRFDRWWESMLKRWARTLDMVIWLDAPDRVHAPDRKRRTTKERSDRENSEFLARYRASFEGVLAALRTRDGPRVIRFDTYQESLGQIAQKALAAFSTGAQTSLSPRIVDEEIQ